MKFSECRNEHSTFLYDGETVGLQYILRMIYEEKELPEIRLIQNDKNFENAVSDVLHQMYEDVQNGIDKEEYELSNLNTTLIEVDVTKEDIEKISDYTYKFK